MEAGGAYNILAAEARLKGTIRSGLEETRQHAWRRLRQIVEGVAAVHNAAAAIDLRRGEPPVVNDPEMAAIVTRTAAELLGAENALSAPNMV